MCWSVIALASATHHVVLCTGSENESMSGPTKSPSSLDFGEIVLASSFGLRQARLSKYGGTQSVLKSVLSQLCCKQSSDIP